MMTTSPARNDVFISGIDSACCKHCGFLGADVHCEDCGCPLHARCLRLLPKNETQVICQLCTKPISRLVLYPMSFREIDEAHDAVSIHNINKRNRKRKSIMLGYGSESVGLDLDKNGEDSGLRTGRWTQEEMTFVDFLISKFESGQLPITNGVKLNDFLATMLNSKQSRLTKKMKNAKLSSKSFKRTSGYIFDMNEARKFSSLEDAFFNSVIDDEERAEIRFHMQKEWREQLSSVCITLGQQLDSGDWLTSIEEMDRRKAKAQDAVRIARRKAMMGLALRQDLQNPDEGVYIYSNNNLLQSTDGLSQPNLHKENEADSSVYSSTSTSSNHVNINRGKNITAFSTTSTYLAKVMSYLQRNYVPFEHVDAWVPSLVPSTENTNPDDGNSKSCRLCFAGCATADMQVSKAIRTMQPLSSEDHFNLTAFGEYSQKFSFRVGCGMPGRIYQSGIPTWEQSVQNAPMHHFERCGGALQWGVKTVVGIPVPSPNVGRIVVALYSRYDREKDHELVGRLYDEFTRLLPSPKWKLIVDLGAPINETPPEEPITQVPTFNDEPSSHVATISESSVGDSRIDAVVSLLGEQIPLDPNSPLSPYVPGFISFRLILLKPQWSDQERELASTLLDSYSSYVASGRAKNDIAILLARDYMFMSQYYTQRAQSNSVAPVRLRNVSTESSFPSFENGLGNTIDSGATLDPNAPHKLQNSFDFGGG